MRVQRLACRDTINEKQFNAIRQKHRFNSAAKMTSKVWLLIVFWKLAQHKGSKHTFSDASVPLFLVP